MTSSRRYRYRAQLGVSRSMRAGLPGQPLPPKRERQSRHIVPMTPLVADGKDAPSIAECQKVSRMHESVVTLQELIATERAAVHVLAETLAHADTHQVALANRTALEEEVRARTKHCDTLDGVIGEYIAAARDDRPAEAAFKLILIQYAAATMVAAAGRGEVTPHGR